MSRSEEGRSQGRMPMFALILALILTIYVGGYVWVRHSFAGELAPESSWVPDIISPTGDRPIQTIFSFGDSPDHALYYFFRPLLILDKQLTGRDYCLVLANDLR